MADEIEMQARAMNEADRNIASGLRLYLEEDYTWEQMVERLEEICENNELEFEGL